MVELVICIMLLCDNQARMPVFLPVGLHEAIGNLKSDLSPEP